ncbi:glycoside hydrolase family 15 [Actinocorallia sp. API 0066]|uniref:glycoside hydrolase family 15 n=1 Tax=Actinocorallia sp. API 0066 TaxID=2896846 RepID=UPI001E383615|nr:glycoside hydrolase family 15 [Actinocorallia sp. API 0066]MCD0453167.1 glycoside hydrolase family 15 [Actinocorallia sp. API 0066]
MATCSARDPFSGPPGYESPGLVGGGGWPYAQAAVSPEQAEGARYILNSSVLRLADGRAMLIPHGGTEAVTLPVTDPRVGAAVKGDRDWLNSGTVPGGTLEHRGMAARALLDLRLLTTPTGASTASWYGMWNYVWPRDAAFHAAAFAATGHPREARDVLAFLARVQEPDGRWDTRYRPDGSAVDDGRAVQLDEIGWVLWATWFTSRYADGATTAPWPMVQRAADWIARNLGPDGLPPAGSDYFERRPSAEQDPDRPTLGVSAPLLVGLRAAAALAQRSGHPVDEARWTKAAQKLDQAIRREYGAHGYPRSPIPNGNMDASVTFLAPPFAPHDMSVEFALGHAVERLSLDNGGLLPGENWPGNPTTAWTPEVALFALADAASGRTVQAAAWLDWLAAHRTSLGVLPEKVDADHRPASVAPLGWTASLVLLTLTAGEHPLPIPPVPATPTPEDPS